MTPQELFTKNQQLCEFWRRTEHYSAALEGLWDAAQRYQQDRGTSFAKFAKQRIRGSVTDQIRADHLISRRAHQRGIKRAAANVFYVRAEVPTPEELLLEKERVLLLRHRVSLTFGVEGALLRATLLEQEHQDVARRRGLSKSWCSRINAQAEQSLARQLLEFRPERRMQKSA